MTEVNNKLNEIMETLVKDGEFVSQATRDKRAYYEATQLKNECEKLESQLNSGVISKEEFAAEIKSINEKLDGLIKEYSK